eukprot:11222427-Lingulodinium_polyedra.AAC.1
MINLDDAELFVSAVHDSMGAKLSEVQSVVDLASPSCQSRWVLARAESRADVQLVLECPRAAG